tara:strand:- start:11417 stop:11722 length:306 start_codon:yes stop_codon:yes gene_type:complete
MSELSQSLSQEYFAVYSQKQFDHIQEIKVNNNEIQNNFPYIYYKTYDNKLVQITEIFRNKSLRSKFDDAIYLGKVKHFHSALVEPIYEFPLQKIKYEQSIP